MHHTHKQTGQCGDKAKSEMDLWVLSSCVDFNPVYQREREREKERNACVREHLTEGGSQSDERLIDRAKIQLKMPMIDRYAKGTQVKWNFTP